MKLFISILFSLIAFSLNACAAKNPWVGEYLYEADLGENVGGDQVIVEYDLKIQDSTCALTIEGYQVSESIVCSVNTDGNTLNVLFKSYSDGSTKNAYDVEVYPVSGVLFKLSSTDKGLITHWENLTPDESIANDGIYFERKL